MADSEVGARAYPIEAEAALDAWMSRREASGVWTSPAGWWYAAWMHRQDEVSRLQAQLAAQAEVIRLAQFVASNEDTRTAGVQGIYALRDALARLDASAQEARQQAGERAQ